MRDLKERSFEFSVRIVRLCQKLDEMRGVSRTLANQLLRSGTSIGANIEEAHGSQSKADFTDKMYIACKEARVPRSVATTRPDAKQTGTTHYWLRLLIATDLMSKSSLSELEDEANQLVAMLTTSVRKLKSEKGVKRENNMPNSLFTTHFSLLKNKKFHENSI